MRTMVLSFATNRGVSYEAFGVLCDEGRQAKVIWTGVTGFGGLPGGSIEMTSSGSLVRQ
jgi:hypothetical protein